MSNNPKQRSGGPRGEDDSKRKALHAYLSDDAHDIWHGVAAEQGVSVSALLEAMAADLGRDVGGAQSFDLIVQRARRVDAERRRR